MRTHQNRIIAVEELLLSREVEGDGPMKPGNPLCNVASRVPIPVKRFRRFRKMRGICDVASP